MPQTSANVIAGNDARASDFNKLVADLTEVYSGGPGVPIGAVIAWWSDNTIPLNYKACDGTVLSDVASPLNGLTLPSLIDRFVRGVAQSNLRTTPQSGGSDSHQLTITEMPSHTHVQNAHDHGAFQNPHNHQVNAGGGFGAGPGNAGLFRVDANSPAVIWSNGSTNVVQPGVGVFANTATNQNTGGDTPFSMLPSYRGLVMIIRVK